MINKIHLLKKKKKYFLCLPLLLFLISFFISFRDEIFLMDGHGFNGYFRDFAAALISKGRSQFFIFPFLGNLGDERGVRKIFADFFSVILMQKIMMRG